MAQIAFVTSANFPGILGDEKPLVEHLAGEGHSVTPLLWSDPMADWASFDLVVIRNCWDYHIYPEPFNDWLDKMSAQKVSLWNPSAMIRWNMRKTYLAELAEYGVNIPTTIWLPSNTMPDLKALLAENGWRKAVLKPVVSASARLTWQVTERNAAKIESQIAAAPADVQFMLQQFMPQVVETGEWSLIYFSGNFSHAVLKRPGPGDFRTQSEFGATLVAAEIPESILLQAQEIIDLLVTVPLYCRVDGIVADDRFILMELELIEPFLFLNDIDLRISNFTAAISNKISTTGNLAAPGTVMLKSRRVPAKTKGDV